MNTVSNTSIAHYDYIDLLRGVAICGVLSVHSTFGMNAAGLTQLPMHAESLLFAGKFGVSLFFVLSAYTLMLSLSGRIGTSQSMFLPYFIRRFFRIAPAYYLILFLVFFCMLKALTATRLLVHRSLAGPTARPTCFLSTDCFLITSTAS